MRGRRKKRRIWRIKVHATHCIGDNDIQTFKAINGFLDKSFAVGQETNITLDSQGPDAVFFGDFRYKLLGSVFTFVVVDGDIASLSSELLAYESTKPSLPGKIQIVNVG